MDLKRFTGPQAGSLKYDLLTAIAIAGLNGTPGFQTSMLRLVALVTARYNWKLDEVSIGQKELARMWAVDERTVKREIKRMIEAKILLQLRPGLRGRVAGYRLNQREIYSRSAPHWQEVGPDFLARMDGHAEPLKAEPPEKVVHVDFRPQAQSAPSTAWGRALARLAESDPELHRNWFASLDFQGFDAGLLMLSAPSGFIAQYVLNHHARRVQDAAALEFPGLRRIHIGA
ncbi:DnaA N-terminal domain-containing protein [Paracoccus aminophilus]|uniref:Replication initiator protein DnaA n=1 Tax=Paracoccus aminophilus JCM 7686 TaxID=1367847 RepID=S5Y0Q1_PARAH|nr:DnaA N-terminal domain-containing protein [Paracoccus aminophilus]AGT11067.1 replication initiator protein DnaA [Paracoccus aminophilus JCM 7686]